ncbi:hypothetical protein RFI_05919, partial [Reticulomyxa filosa]
NNNDDDNEDDELDKLTKELEKKTRHPLDHTKVSYTYKKKFGTDSRNDMYNKERYLLKKRHMSSQNERRRNRSYSRSHSRNNRNRSHDRSFSRSHSRSRSRSRSRSGSEQRRKNNRKQYRSKKTFTHYADGDSGLNTSSTKVNSKITFPQKNSVDADNTQSKNNDKNLITPDFVDEKLETVASKE